MMKKENLRGQMSFDNIIKYSLVFTETQIKKIQSYLEQPKWKFGHYSNSNYMHKKFWNMELTDESFFSEDLWEVIESKLKEKRLYIDRIYANGQTYGLDGSFHQDDIRGYTFLYYCNTKWNIEWGGNTVFYEEKTKQSQSFLPEPNTGLFFPGNILHYAKSPSRDFYGLRTTLVYKLLKT